MLKSKITYADEVQEILKVAREKRGHEELQPESTKRLFGHDEKVTLSELSDNELLQVIFLDALWRLDQMRILCSSQETELVAFRKRYKGSRRR